MPAGRLPTSKHWHSCVPREIALKSSAKLACFSLFLKCYFDIHVKN